MIAAAMRVKHPASDMSERPWNDKDIPKCEPFQPNPSIIHHHTNDDNGIPKREPLQGPGVIVFIVSPFHSSVALSSRLAPDVVMVFAHLIVF
jgi:hypothetical protein